jgi:hypothetical protein
MSFSRILDVTKNGSSFISFIIGAILAYKVNLFDVKFAKVKILPTYTSPLIGFFLYLASLYGAYRLIPTEQWQPTDSTRSIIGALLYPFFLQRMMYAIVAIPLSFDQFQGNFVLATALSALVWSQIINLIVT